MSAWTVDARMPGMHLHAYVGMSMQACSAFALAPPHRSEQLTCAVTQTRHVGQWVHNAWHGRLRSDSHAVLRDEMSCVKTSPGVDAACKMLCAHVHTS